MRFLRWAFVVFLLLVSLATWVPRIRIAGVGPDLLLGVVVVFAFVLVSSLITFAIIKATYGMRVTAAEEDAGLDIVEHGMYGYPEQFIPASELVGSGLPGSPTHASSVLSTATPASSQA